MREGFSIQAARQLLASGVTRASEASLRVEGWTEAGVLHGLPWCRAGGAGSIASRTGTHTSFLLDQLSAHPVCSSCSGEISVRWDNPITERCWIAFERAAAIRGRLARSGERRRTAISLGNLLAELCEARRDDLGAPGEIAQYAEEELAHTDETIAMLRGELQGHEEELLTWVRFEVAGAQAGVWSWPRLTRDLVMSTTVPALQLQHTSQMMSLMRREISSGKQGSSRPVRLLGSPGARYQEVSRKLLGASRASDVAHLAARVEDLSMCEAEAAALRRVVEAQLQELSGTEMGEYSWLVAHPNPGEGAQRAVMRLYADGPVAVVPRIVGEWVQSLSVRIGAQACPLPSWADARVVETAAGLWAPGTGSLSSLRDCLEAARDILA